MTAWNSSPDVVMQSAGRAHGARSPSLAWPCRGLQEPWTGVGLGTARGQGSALDRNDTGGRVRTESHPELSISGAQGHPGEAGHRAREPRGARWQRPRASPTFGPGRPLRFCIQMSSDDSPRLRTGQKEYFGKQPSGAKVTKCKTTTLGEHTVPKSQSIRAGNCC